MASKPEKIPHYDFTELMRECGFEVLDAKNTLIELLIKGRKVVIEADVDFRLKTKVLG